MSKAFTSEETADAAPLVRPPPRLAPGEKRYVTPEGHAQLRAASAALARERVEAMRLPDHERVAGLQAVEARLALVEATLAALTVLGPEAVPEGTVGFGTWVTVEDEDGARTTWRLVGPDEADARRGLVSVDSPVARALLQARVGDTVDVRRPNGPAELTIVDVRRRG